MPARLLLLAVVTVVVVVVDYCCGTLRVRVCVDGVRVSLFVSVSFAISLSSYS